MMAARFQPGDEVITVAHTFVATISAVVHAGGTPVLVDVGRDFNMDMDAAERAIAASDQGDCPGAPSTDASATWIV